MSAPWVITRPLDDGDRDVAALHRRGIAALALPVIERVPVAWRARRPDLVVLTSASCVDAVCRAWPGWSPPPRLAAMAPETAARAASAGLPVTIRATGGAVRLAEAVVAAWEALGRPATALYPTSQAGHASAEQNAAVALLAPYLRVERAIVVELKRPEGLDARLRAVPAGARWVVASPSAARALFACAGLPPASRLLCYGASTFAACDPPPGWPAPTLGIGATVIDAILEVAASTLPLEPS